MHGTIHSHLKFHLQLLATVNHGECFSVRAVHEAKKAVRQISGKKCTSLKAFHWGNFMQTSGSGAPNMLLVAVETESQAYLFEDA